MDCEKKKGKGIALVTLSVLEANEIDIANCRAQAYDNGSDMSGIYNGAQAMIARVNPFAKYLPCSTHSLNLAGVHAAESSVPMKTYFGNIQKLYNFFSSSPARWKILKETADISLHSMSTTRWSARIEAVKPLSKKPKEIVLALQTVKSNLDLPSDLINEVDSLLKWIRSFDFVLLTTFWVKVLQSINDVSILLQGTQITLDEEVRLIGSLVDDIRSMRLS